jgi:hypothetical protein
VKPRRLTIAELSEILDSVAAKQKIKTVCPVVPLVETKTHYEIYQSKPKKYISKAVALGAPEKILALVALYPGWGTKKLANALADQGVSLSRQSIHKILCKHNLNLPAMRKAWQATQKETNP